MVVNLKTETINVNELKKNEKSILLVEGDIIVPDVNPDIGKILMADANAEIVDKQWQGGKINVDGCVFVNILYTPEKIDESTPKLKSINTKLDFSDSCDCAYENPSVSAKAAVLSVNFGLVNSRKVNVKITVEIISKAYTKNNIAFAVGAEENSGAETKMQNISIHSTAVDCRKTFVFSEMLEVPAAKCDIEEILKTNVTVNKGECKTSDNKITLKGAVNVTTLYAGFEEGFIHECMEHELQFFEEAEVEGLSDDCMCNVTYDVKDVSVKIAEDLNGDPRMVELNLTVCANITASRIYDMEILEDIYYPGKVCDTEKEMITLRKNLNEGTSRASLKNTVTLPEGSPDIFKVSAAVAHPVIREHEIVDGKLILKGDVTCFIVYCGADGVLCSEVYDYLFEHGIDIDMAMGESLCEYDISVTGTNFNILSEREIEIRTNVEFFVRMTEAFDVEVIKACSAEDIPDDINKLPQLIIYFVQKGDTLWDIAKHYNTTVKRIKDANHIDELSAPGEKILIPAR